MERYREIIPDFERFMEVLERPQPHDVRVNTIKSSREEVVDVLGEEGIEAEPRRFNPRFLTLDAEPGKTLAHWLGLYYVQEASSAVPPMALDPQPGEAVLDMCAAPGSKTTQMAARMDNRGEIVANDVRGGRLRALLANVYQTGCLNVQALERDGRNLPEDRQFDRVLVDAPCSGEGNAREQAELRSGADTGTIQGRCGLQEQLLEKAFALCKDGGTVVYSTCTFAPEENELVVREFVDEHELVDPGFGFEHSPGLTSWEGEELNEELENCVRVYPHQLDSGGMFVAKFRV